MIDINSVHLPSAGFDLVERSDEMLVWENDRPERLTLNFFAKPPDLPCNADNTELLREFYRFAIARMGGGLVSVDTVTINDIASVKTIFKFLTDPQGICYIGAITVPFQEFSYVVKVQCPEVGTTGSRQAIVLDDCLARGTVTLDAGTQTLKGWSQDPYNAESISPLMRNLSEAESYDEQFPEHPLSRARSLLHRTEQSLSFAPDVLASNRFNRAPAF